MFIIWSYTNNDNFLCLHVAQLNIYSADGKSKWTLGYYFNKANWRHKQMLTWAIPQKRDFWRHAIKRSWSAWVWKGDKLISTCSDIHQSTVRHTVYTQRQFSTVTTVYWQRSLHMGLPDISYGAGRVLMVVHHRECHCCQRRCFPGATSGALWQFGILFIIIFGILFTTLQGKVLWTG